MERDEITMLVAHNIEAHMRAQGLDAAELARRSRVNPTGVYDILAGRSRSPKIETVAKIAKGLGLPLVALLAEPAADAMRADMLKVFEGLPVDLRRLLLQTGRSWLPPESEDPQA